MGGKLGWVLGSLHAMGGILGGGVEMGGSLGTMCQTIYL